MGDENQKDQSPDLTAISAFAKMVRKQLKKAYNIDVRRLSKKVDKHGQPKAILKVGIGDEACELWFRDGADESIVVDKIADGKAVGTIKVNKPICHLRTAAMLDGEAKLPTIAHEKSEPTAPEWPIREGAVKAAAEEIVQKIADLTSDEFGNLWEHLMGDPVSFVEEYADRLDEEERKKLLTLTRGIREEMETEPTEEPEDFEEEFTAPTNKIAIVDASVIEGLDNDLAAKAIIVPIKYPGAVFEVVATYDDTILRNLTISPAEIEQNGVNVVKKGGVGEGPERLSTEGIAPLSHDSSPERAIRKHTSIKQKHHMKHATDVPARIADPIQKGVVKRDQKKKDQRKKLRTASEDIVAKRDMIKMLLDESTQPLDALQTSDLVFAKKVIAELDKHDSGLRTRSTIAKIDQTLNDRARFDVEELLECVTWLRKNQQKVRGK